MEIESLLPQRQPFLFVDALLAVSRDGISGVKTYSKDFMFFEEFWPGEKTVPPAILIESLIQVGGAGVTKLGIFQRAAWGLAGLSSIRVYDRVRAGETTKMHVTTSKVSHKVLQQAGETFCNDKKILEASWLCLRLK